MLTIRVSPTYVHVVSGSPIPSGSTGAPQVTFQLDDYWNDYAVTAAFEGNGNVRHLSNIANGQVYTVPWECISQEGVLTIRVFGARSGSLSTTLSATVQVVASGIESVLPEEPTPSAYEQFVSEIAEDANIANTAVREAFSALDSAVGLMEQISEMDGLLSRIEAAAEEIPSMQEAANQLVNAAAEAVETANQASETALQIAAMPAIAVQETNKSRALRFWIGDMSDYHQLLYSSGLADDTHYIITDDPTIGDLSTKVEELNAYMEGLIWPPYSLSDALDCEPENPMALRNHKRYLITSSTANIPDVEGFCGFREPVLYCDANCMAMVTLTEVRPVPGRRWINLLSNDHQTPADNAWTGWIES